MATRKRYEKFRNRWGPQTNLDAPNMSEPGSSDSLIYRVLLHLQNMGNDKPKTVEKLRNALRKWNRAVIMFDPFDVLKKENFGVKVGREVSVSVTEEVIATNLQKSALKSAKCAGSLISVIGDRCPYGVHLVADVHKRALALTSDVLDKCPEPIKFQEKMDRLVQRLQFKVDGSHRCQSTSMETLVNDLLTTGLKNLQRFKYILVGANGAVTYNFPSKLLTRVMHNILVTYEKDIRKSFETGASVNGWNCCYTIRMRCNFVNWQLDSLVETMDVSDETKQEMLRIFSDALDTLHKCKSDQISVIYDRQNLMLTSQRESELFKRVFQQERLGQSDYSTRYSRSLSRSPSRSGYSSGSSSRSPLRSRSNTPVSQTHSRSRVSRSNTPVSMTHSRSRSNTPDLVADETVPLSRSLSWSPLRKQSKRHTPDKESRSRNQSADSGSSTSDIEVKRRPRKRSAVRSISPDDKRRRYESDATAKAKEFSIVQAEVLSGLLGLHLFDTEKTETSETRKVSEFEELCNGLKSLSVEDVAKIPDDICLIDLMILDALDKMGDDKPKSVKALMNALRPVCKVLFVLNPKKLAKVSNIKMKPKRNSKARPPEKAHIPLAMLRLSETICLNQGGLFNPMRIPNYICLDFPSRNKIKKRRSNSSFINVHGMPTEETLNRLRKSGLNTQVNVERSEVYGMLVKKALCRARAIGSTVVKADKRDGGRFVKKIAAWKQTVIKRRSTEESMDSDIDDNRQNTRIDVGLDFKNRKLMYDDLVQNCVETKEVSFERLLSQLLETNLLARTESGNIIYLPEFEHDQWKCDWRSREEILLKTVHFKENNVL